MSWYGFIRASAARIAQGEVLVSQFATAGQNTTAVPDLEHPFIVYNDAERLVTLHRSDVGAAHEWDKINRRHLRLGRT